MSTRAAEMSAGTSRGGAILVTILFAGLASEAAWEIWARVITPLWVGDPLERAALVHSAFSLADRTTAETVHLLLGLLAYPFGYIFIVQPIAHRLVPFMPWWIVALGYERGCLPGCRRSWAPLS